jgi:hypothetical protein
LFKPFAPKLVHGYFKAVRAGLKRFVPKIPVGGCSPARQVFEIGPLTCCFAEPVSELREPVKGRRTAGAGLFTGSELMQRFVRIGA